MSEPMTPESLLKQLREHVLHYGDQERAANVVQSMIEEIEGLRKQFRESIGAILAQVKENSAIIKDAEARLDRAGL